MESVELSLKNINRKEKPVATDDFSVDDLLDFSNDDVFVEDETKPKAGGVSVSLNDDEITLNRTNELSSTACEEDFGSELAVPTDDLAELEWLSNFVEDSYSAPTKKPVWLTGDRRHPVTPVNEGLCFKAPLPVKNRTKRPRTGVSVWSLGSPSLTDSSSSSSSSSNPSTPLWLSGAEFLDEEAVKRQKKAKKKKSVRENGGGQTQTRRCSHCGVQKTPQWRAGPLGAKTLCNACGVRFKSGRLLPEYRPACSPTFSSELHSNHHRKVIEMRQKKEMSTDVDESGMNRTVQAVQSF
ncbi:GATA transcription factor 6 [Raphanus sativus]|uniref:GATA transcription factor n=1 Tax=Raphanus sativus TaxID=3726 RepID=A0A6J0LBT3_RAPSA|nr:GATA transcription factor 6 [Raphanus sativus]